MGRSDVLLEEIIEDWFSVKPMKTIVKEKKMKRDWTNAMSMVLEKRQHIGENQTGLGSS